MNSEGKHTSTGDVNYVGMILGALSQTDTDHDEVILGGITGRIGPLQLRWWFAMVNVGRWVTSHVGG